MEPCRAAESLCQLLISGPTLGVSGRLTMEKGEKDNESQTNQSLDEIEANVDISGLIYLVSLKDLPLYRNVQRCIY